MAWIDDDIMKHFHGSLVKDLIYSVRKYFLTVREFNALLNPEKLSFAKSEIEFAGRFCTAKTICITGSNGKTTTTMLTYHLLKKAGLHIGLTGS